MQRIPLAPRLGMHPRHEFPQRGPDLFAPPRTSADQDDETYRTGHRYLLAGRLDDRTSK
jgi:hypothetical protein